jgi:hypothetical protein
VQVGDLVQFRHSSVGVRKGSLGLVVGKKLQKTMEPGQDNYFLYNIKTLDGKIRGFSDSYLKKITPGLYST